MARLYHRLQVAAHLFRRHADHVLLEAAGMSTAQAAVLVVIAEVDQPTQSAVGRLLGVSEPSMTEMVDRLVRNGHVERRRSECDGRVRILELTPRGSDAQSSAQRAFASVNQLVHDSLGAARAAEIAVDLQLVIDALSSADTGAAT